VRSRRRSPSPASASSNRRNIVATPGKTLTPRSRIDPSTASGENRSRRPTVAPVTRGASSAPFSPYEWDSGRTASTTSSAVSAMTGSIHDATPAATACCESTAPFGAPVEPEVYRINAGASLLGDGQSHSSAATACTTTAGARSRSEEHTSELQSRFDLVCRLLLEKKKYDDVLAELVLD